MLLVRDIETAYDASQVLSGISLSVNEGEVVTLLGRNGMGKTTAVRSIMGTTSAHKGSITFEGVELRNIPDFKIAKLGLGLVPEGRHIFPNLTVRENLLATADNRTGSDDPWTLKKKVLELFPLLAERLGSMGSQLSGGRTTNARDQPGADDQSQTINPRRGDGGPGTTCPRPDMGVP